MRITLFVRHIINISKRLKGAIDSRIAEEQAKIKAAPASPARSASTAKRTRPKPKVEDDGSRGPDPSTFVIEDESEPPSRIGTPAPTEGGKKETATAESAAPKTMAEGAAERNGDAPSGAVVELPPEVKAKLRKLEKLEFRYQGSKANASPKYRLLMLRRSAAFIPYRTCPRHLYRAIREDP